MMTMLTMQFKKSINDAAEGLTFTIGRSAGFEELAAGTCGSELDEATGSTEEDCWDGDAGG